MLDNLQTHYLSQLESAQATALHGNLTRCLDICFELRLKPDLASYTRAMVNLTLADVCPVDKHPDKAKFADEAQRLAKELLEEGSATEDAVWTGRLQALHKDAVGTMERVQEEVAQYERTIKASEAAKEGEKEGLEKDVKTNEGDTES